MENGRRAKNNSTRSVERILPTLQEVERRNRGGLQQFTRRQVADQPTVGGQELVIGKLFEANPAHLLIDAALDLAGELMHGKKLQIDGAAMTVVMADAGDAGADGGVECRALRPARGPAPARGFRRSRSCRRETPTAAPSADLDGAGRSGLRRRARSAPPPRSAARDRQGADWVASEVLPRLLV